MTRADKVKFLIKVADMLDRDGQSEMADMADQMLRDEAAKGTEGLDVEIPQEEFELLQQVYEALGQSLT
jgi:hypothetical protein